jgi:hypothetical protein
MFELVLEPCILNVHVLFLKGLIPKHGGAPTAATRRAMHWLLNHDVLGPLLIILLEEVLMPLWLPLTRIEKNINNFRLCTNGCNTGPKNGTNEREALHFELMDLMRGMAVVAILLLAAVAGLHLETS